MVNTSQDRKRSLSDNDRRRLHHCKEYMLAHLHETLTLKQLSAACGLATGFFKYGFREMYGEPPRQYMIREKMAKAKQMFTTSDLPVKAVAAAIGFKARNLYKTYKKFYGDTPQHARATSGADHA